MAEKIVNGVSVHKVALHGLLALTWLTTPRCTSTKRDSQQGDVVTSHRATERLTTLRVLSKRRLRMGDDLRLSVQLRSQASWEHAIDSVTVHLGQWTAVFQEALITVPLTQKHLSLGKHEVLVQVHAKNGQTERHVAGYTLLAQAPPKAYRYTLDAVLPHDPDAYTQGLLYHQGYLYESTGQKGSSFLRQVDIPSAKVLRQATMPGDVFGEGIALYEQKIYQLTWEARKGYIYRLHDLSLVDSFRYDTEGWGLTLWNNQLVMSDGTEVLRFYNPRTMEKLREVQVYDHEAKVDSINELETVGKRIYANIYQTQHIKVIAPETGTVVGVVALEDLYDFSYYGRRRDVMNGIAYREDEDRLYLTGKWWPKLFVIRVRDH